MVVEEINYPSFELNVPEQRRKCNHGAIIKLVASNICGSDLHLVRGRLPPKEGTVLGHEMTGEIVEVGPDVENFKPGDLVRMLWWMPPLVLTSSACNRCRCRSMWRAGAARTASRASPARA